MYTYIKLSKYVYISKCRNIWNSLPNINCLIESPRFLNPQQLSKTTAAQQKKMLPLKLTLCHLNGVWLREAQP